MDHPLRMDAEAMRRAGYATVDALVARLADPGADPVLRRATPAQMRARLAGPPPEQPGDYGAVLERLLEDVLPYASRTDHPGYFAFVPSFTTWPAGSGSGDAGVPAQRATPLRPAPATGRYSRTRAGGEDLA